MKKAYISPDLYIIDDVCDPMLTRASQDIDSVDNNGNNGGSTLGGTPGIDYGGDHEGGDLNEGDLE